MANLNRTKFFELIDKSNIKEYDKLSIKAAVDYFDSDKNKELESRSYLFKGDTGVGKTFIAEKLVEEINQEILYMGTGESLNYRKFDSMSELIENIEKRKNQVIYIDDLNFILSKGDYGAIESEDLRNLMRILDIVKKQENKILIITLNDITDFCEQIIDRVEIKIEFDLPTNENKKDFLKQKFSKYLSESKINTLTYKSIGYNYRDLGELIKLAYRIDKKLSLNSLNQALEIYKPTQLYDYEIINSDVN
jgi:AAA+ superfamily predicted ATPase